MNLNIKDFKSKLTEKFGKLTPQAEHCAEDFYENYESIKNSIISGEIQLIASPNVLARKIPIPSYTKYKTYNTFSKISILIGIIVLFINWKISVLFFLVYFLLKKISNKLRNNMTSELTQDLKNVLINSPEQGILDISEFYITGIIALHSQIGKAFLPLLPSYSVFGIEKYCRIE